MNLQNIQITFNTHNDNKNASTVLHVFVKNRRPDTSTPMGPAGYIANHLAYQFNQRPNFAGINEFLGCAENLAPGTSFDDPSTHTFDIPLRSPSISNEEIFLPVVYIHMLADDSDRWIFSYTITFSFDDGHSQFSFSSNFNGVTGIILDQDNRDYYGICVENPFNTMPAVYKPASDLVLTKIRLAFSTHNDDKNSSTTLNVHIVNRLNATSSQDILVASNILPGQEFSDPSTHEVTFPPAAGLSPILMQDIVLPQIFIDIGAGEDRWIFDYKIYFYFTSPTNSKKWWTAVSETDGIILDQDNHKYADVYNGDSFPTVDPLGQPELSPIPANYPVPTSYTAANPKKIYISYLQKKLDDFINSRQANPLYKIRLDNSGRFNSDTLPESYYDLQSITADPPAPGTLSQPGYNEPTAWVPSPTSLGQLYKLSVFDIYFNNINSQTLKASVDPTSPTPLCIEVDFDCSGTNQIVGGSSVSTEGATLTSFTITLHLTLTWEGSKGLAPGQTPRNCVDLMSWAPEILNLTATPAGPNEVNITGQFLGKPVNATDASLAAYQAKLKGQVIDVRMSADGLVEDALRDKIFDKLTNPPSGFDILTLREQLNSTVNSWLLGGTLASDVSELDANRGNYPNGAAVTADVSIASDAGGPYIALSFNGPGQLFVPAPYSSPVPSPGALANIDHIIVLTMENRSFDHMLGYLSLPVAQQGMGRTDIDGLKGGEINYANGVPCPSAPFAPLDTIMNPDPPHSWEPVARAIHKGAMDGFAQAYYDESGIEVAKRIMMYHTGVNVPTYDAMARDFAICHRWFAPFPGPTFCNRFHELTGFLNRDADGFWESHNSSPKRAVFTATIFDYLTQHGVSWKYFENYYCFLRFFQNHTFDNTNIADYGDPGLGFANVVQTGNLPSVTFIDPHFIEFPPDGNCDGPPADVAQGQLLVQEVVNAVVSSPTWNKTMLIITYDEHGGFYDHVPPPPAPVIAENTGLPTTYGVRVPAFVVSPWVAGGSVFGHDATSNTPALYFDHTSILKTIATRFLSPDMPPMGARYEAANDLSSIIGSQARLDLRPFIPYTFAFAPSGLNLEVNGGAATPGLTLWQTAAAPNSDAQKFAFEDAGGGHFYIRTFTGRFYLTVDAPGADPTQPLAVRQEAKYPAGAAGVSPDSQKWSVIPPLVSVVGSPMYTVVSAAFPDKVLQSLGASKNSGVSVVVDVEKSAPIILLGSQNKWIITSPLMPSGLRFAPPTLDGPPPIASPSALTFPPVELTNTSAQQTVILKPPAGAQFIISSLAIVSDVGAEHDFPTVPPPGSPPPYGSIQLQNDQLALTVWFRPTAAGARTAVIQIAHNLADSPTTISVSGTGVPAALPVLAISAGSMYFSPKKPAPPPLKLTNTGTAPLIISSMVVSTPAFSVSTACVGTIAPGQSCTVTVTVRTWPGEADIVITHNAAGSPTRIGLTSTDKTGTPR